MEIGFTPVPPPRAVRPAAELRVPVRQPGDRGQQAALSPNEPPATRPSGTVVARDDRAAEAPTLPAVRGDFLAPRIQPDLPAPARRALETFVGNSFSETEDPASALGGIDVFA